MRPNNFRAISAYGLLAVILTALDQSTKYFAYHSGFGNFLSALHPIFSKQIFPNYNFAFSLPVPTAIMYTVYIILIGSLSFWFVRMPKHTHKTSLAFVLILAGAFSNIGDRIWLGYVRDFIYVFWGNIFNLADLYIVAGILLLVF